MTTGKDISLMQTMADTPFSAHVGGVKETTNLTDRKGREKCLTKYYVHA